MKSLDDAEKRNLPLALDAILFSTRVDHAAVRRHPRRAEVSLPLLLKWVTLLPNDLHSTDVDQEFEGHRPVWDGLVQVLRDVDALTQHRVAFVARLETVFQDARSVFRRRRVEHDVDLLPEARRRPQVPNGLSLALIRSHRELKKRFLSRSYS